MNYSLNTRTFFVKELFNPQLGKTGEYYFYVLKKEGLSHKRVVEKIGVSAWFCGIKDKNASTIQWFCTKEKIPNINEPGFVVEFKGQGNKRIYVGAHKGNYFEVEVDLDETEKKLIKKFNQKKEFVCNYFDEQRFSDWTIKIKKLIEEKKFGDALKLFLTGNTGFETEKSAEVKRFIKNNWGNWTIFNEKKDMLGEKKLVLFNFLKNNPLGFKEAFKLVEPKSLSIMIKSSQAKRFNEKLNEIAKAKNHKNFLIEINNAEYYAKASKSFPKKIVIKPSSFELQFKKNGLIRNTYFCAKKFKVKQKNNKTFICFELKKGEYATVFLKYLRKWFLEKINKGVKSIS